MSSALGEKLFFIMLSLTFQFLFSFSEITEGQSYTNVKISDNLDQGEKDCKARNDVIV